MNFFLPGFFDYLQNHQSCVILQHLEQQYRQHGSSAAPDGGGTNDPTSSPPSANPYMSVSITLLALLMLVMTVEGVILFLTTLYGWRRNPMTTNSSPGQSVLWWDEDEVDDDDDYVNVTNSNGDESAEREGQEEDGGRRTRRHLRRRNQPETIRSLSVGGGNSSSRNGTTENHRRTRRPTLGEQKWDEAANDGSYESCCPICLVDFLPNDRTGSGRTRCCRNCFHRDCLEQWLRVRPSCPCCRRNLLVVRRSKLPKLVNATNASGGAVTSASTISSNTFPSRRRFRHPLTINGDGGDDYYDDDDDDDDIIDNDNDGGNRDSISDTTITIVSSDSSEWTPDVVPDFAVDSWDHFWFLIF